MSLARLVSESKSHLDESCGARSCKGSGICERSSEMKRKRLACGKILSDECLFKPVGQNQNVSMDLLLGFASRLFGMLKNRRIFSFIQNTQNPVNET
jgi:hypothetical protein